MKCPHCLVGFHSKPNYQVLLETNRTVVPDKEGFWSVLWEKCPECGRAIIFLQVERQLISGAMKPELRLVHPKGISRAPLSPDVPDEIANDYKEACLVLLDSPKASAALGRRCLQNVLREKSKVKKSDLSKEIDQVLPSLPSHLAEAVDAIRHLGNFAAHPTKSTNTGEIVDVEPGEAEWTLDTLEGLFDFYFVQPAILARKKDALNKKLTDTGKPPMK